MIRIEDPDDTWWEESAGDTGDTHIPTVAFDPIEPEVLLGPDGSVARRVWRQIGFYR